jgi:serine/threonine-protein phosphatase 4 catalytic subunit
MVDPNKILAKLRKYELPTEAEIKELCDKARELLDNVDNIAILNCPITVCGDIHGQFEDLLEIFDVGGEVPETNYIFLGDFVDRGNNSIETFLFLLTLKIKYPNRITLLRGNHESRQITQAYGFYEECSKRYGSVNVWKYCTDIFDYFQLAAVIEGTVFCVHGGLSPNVQTLDDIRKIERKQEVPRDGPMSDILWSDPDLDTKNFQMSPRGAGFFFGEEEVKKFNHTNNFELIARAHQLIQEGYQFMFENGLVTVWSAPNYCYRCGNDASVMEFDEHMNRGFKVFEACPQDVRRQPDKRPAPEYFL